MPPPPSAHTPHRLPDLIAVQRSCFSRCYNLRRKNSSKLQK